MRKVARRLDAARRPGRRLVAGALALVRSLRHRCQPHEFSPTFCSPAVPPAAPHIPRSACSGQSSIRRYSLIDRGESAASSDRPLDSKMDNGAAVNSFNRQRRLCAPSWLSAHAPPIHQRDCSSFINPSSSASSFTFCLRNSRNAAKSERSVNSVTCIKTPLVRLAANK